MKSIITSVTRGRGTASSSGISPPFSLSPPENKAAETNNLVGEMWKKNQEDLVFSPTCCGFTAGLVGSEVF